MRKYIYGGGCEFIWCGFNTITANHRKDLSHVVKVKLLGVNVYLCLAKIPDSRLTRYRVLLNKKRGKNPEKKARP